MGVVDRSSAASAVTAPQEMPQSFLAPGLFVNGHTWLDRSKSSIVAGKQRCERRQMGEMTCSKNQVQALHGAEMLETEQSS